MMPLFGGLLLILRVHHAFAVTELTDANFYDYAKDKDVLLVDFYAPWCSDCKALDPDFENAAANLGTRSVDLAKVDCFGAGKGLCGTYGVKRWPTLKNFNRGQYTGDYTGGLTSAEIAGYISTVENSVHPVVNPYAAPFNPQPAAVQTEQCVTKCKISRLSNKQRCFEGCKAKSYGKKVMLPQPVINEKSCAKCRQPQVAGKYSTYCSAIEEKCRYMTEGKNEVFKIKFAKSSYLDGSALGRYGLPKNTENIMNEYIRKPNLIREYLKQTNIGIPKLTIQPSYEDNKKNKNIATGAILKLKNSISESIMSKKAVEYFTPNQSSTVPYDRGDKKQKVDKKNKKQVTPHLIGNVHVNGVSVFSDDSVE